MIVAVTGAAGHIGANLVRELLRRGQRVRALVRSDTRALEGLALERVPGDTLEPASLDTLFRGAELVYHLAGRISIVGDQDGLVMRTNHLGTRNVVEAALRAGARRLVHFSSIHALVQQPLDQPLDESRPLAGEDTPAYDRSKAAGEREILAGVQRGLDAVMVNPTSVFGPEDHKPSLMGQVILDLVHRKFPALVAGGFDWVDVRDVVQGAMAAAERGRTGERYLLGGRWHSVRQLAEQVELASGVRQSRLVAPLWLARVGVPFVGAYSRIARRAPLFTKESLDALQGHRQILHDKASRELGYQPRPLADTVRDTIEWFRQAGRLERTRDCA